jgi:hypothetical protein
VFILIGIIYIYVILYICICAGMFIYICICVHTKLYVIENGCIYLCNIFVYTCIYRTAVAVNSLLCKPTFFANKKYFPKSFANPTSIFRRGIRLKSFAKSFTQRNTFANSEKKIGRGVSCWNPAGLGNLKPLRGPLERLPYTYVYVYLNVYKTVNRYVCFSSVCLNLFFIYIHGFMHLSIDVFVYMYRCK